MRTILIDGDIIVYQQASLHQKEIDWGEGVVTTVTQDALAKKAAVDQVERYKRKLKADHAIVCLSDTRHNWRKQVMPSYKTNRKKLERPILYDTIRDMLDDRAEVALYPWLEADDVMGIYSTDPKLIPGEKIIVSVDKDMRSIPGKLFNPNKESLGVQVIEEFEADYFFMKQTLMGDPIDGYYGIKGIGPKKAEKILAEALEMGDEKRAMWKAVVSAYLEAGMTEQDALQNARVARITRSGEYDIEKHKVILWKPPKL